MNLVTAQHHLKMKMKIHSVQKVRIAKKMIRLGQVKRKNTVSGDHAALRRPLTIGWENNEQTK